MLHHCIAKPTRLRVPTHIPLPFFLWNSVVAWGIALEAKLFDLLVIAGGWSSAPPESLTSLPYGPRFRVNPGHFFLPVSLVTLTGTVGAVVTSWARAGGSVSIGSVSP